MELRWYQTEAVNAMLAAKDNSVVVLPTGSGKTLVMHSFVEQFPGRVLLLSHVKEILSQNFNTLAPLNEVGLYSAGLGVKKIDRITIAGIHSVYANMQAFKADIVIIDECHMVSDTGMYKTVLAHLGCRYMGLTATPYRLKDGFIHGSTGMFDSVCYEAPVSKLTKQGYLCPLRTYGSKQELDTQGIAIQAGDFKLKDMSLAFDRDVITSRIVGELSGYSTVYKHWLIFAIDIAHAENIASLLNQAGIMTEAVHSKSPRDQAILDFKEGKIQCLVNVNILTIGFDYPLIDLIGVIRPTKSTTLHVQMIGRGTRIAPGKDHCMVKDFAGNLKRLGMLDKVVPPTAMKKGKGGKPWTKECPQCQAIVHSATRVCSCGHKFSFQHHLQETAHVEVKSQWYKVKKVFYNLHHKQGSPTSMKVTYQCGMRMFSEWVTLDHKGYANRMALIWLSKRWKLHEPRPLTVKDLFNSTAKLWEPVEIKVDDSQKYPKILAVK